MAGDQRDWYRDWWRRKTGYTERAAFRMSHADVEREKFTKAWRRNLGIAALVVLCIVALAVLR